MAGQIVELQRFGLRFFRGFRGVLRWVGPGLAVPGAWGLGFRVWV